MSKLIKILALKLLSLSLILTLAACAEPTQQPSKISQTDQSANNVGNNQEYQYKVTSITENGEIHGKAINKVSSDNAGIFLYQSELDFSVQPGDNIVVVWGEYEDEFKSIEKVEE